MIRIETRDCRDVGNNHIGFLYAEDKERELYLHCKIWIYSDHTYDLDKFLDGSVGKYKFKYWDSHKDTLLFRGRGRGRKPEWAESAMKDFLQEVQLEILGKTIRELV